MSKKYYFPFGQELKKVQQKAQSPKKVFVLGVYASAVHARWEDKNGKQKIAAFAVASEPEIFWRGNGAEEIISKINIPEDLGKLTVPKNKRMNGPSGNALDELFLASLGFNRDSAWLCDLLPYSRVNDNQYNVIKKYYTEDIIERYNLKPANIPRFSKKELNSADRRSEILRNLKLLKPKPSSYWVIYPFIGLFVFLIRDI